MGDELKKEYEEVRFERDMGQWICRNKKDGVELGMIVEANFDLKYKFKPNICFCHYWHDKEILDAISEFLGYFNSEQKERPKIVCLCGSTRFKGAFERVNKEETLKGNIVLSVGVYKYREKNLCENKINMLNELHLRKIDLAEEIIILNCEGYIGESARNEIEYAEKLGKKIRYLED